MQKAKKIFSALLAVVMLVSVFTVGVTAGAPTLSGTYKIGIGFEYLHEDGTPATSVYPGETITVNIYATASQANQAVKAANFQVWFNSAVYEYVDGSRVWADGLAPLVKDSSIVETITSGTVYNNVTGKLTTAEEAYGWDTGLGIQCNINTLAEGTYLVQENADTPIVTVQFKVKDVAVGTAATIGAPAATTFVKRGAVYNYVQTTNVAKPTAATVTLLDATEELVVAEPAPSSIITDGKDGIRFEKNEDGTYANKVSVRTKALIAATEIQSRLGGITDNEAVEDKILEAGFVYIADANGTLNPTTAQTVAKTKANEESIDKHVKKSVSYIQYDGTNYSFTCLAEIPHADIATADFNAYAYIVIDIDGDDVADDDEWFFAAAGNEASPSDLYTAHSGDAWSKYGWGTAPALNS